MPRRNDIESILIIGSGPIVIGQACEFDYSGTQACRVLKEEGYRVILANSNPATIMTDPDFADATYIEPLTWEVLSAIIDREQPDAVLPTLGGQTGLNIAMELFERGLIGVPGKPEMIGANAEAIATAEDRGKFKIAMTEIGLESCRSRIAHNMDEARVAMAEIGLPTMIRPAYILGGRGTGIAYSVEEFEKLAASGIEASPISEILVEESIVGWKEYELEVMRDHADNCVIICGIENFDPMGVHTGDSITVAPIQTLTDVEYQQMRDAAIACIRRVGVETGGSNVQFAVNPVDGRQIVIEMNPRVSRSSALASKATGFPIAKIAAKLAVGYTLDELSNDITGGRTPASFEPAIDYVVTKIPRFAFEKFPKADARLTTQMKSVGEVMAIGRTFQESMQKALRGLEVGVSGFDPMLDLNDPEAESTLKRELIVPGADRIWYLADAFRAGKTVAEVFELTRIDEWFLVQIEDLVKDEEKIKTLGLVSIDRDLMYKLKRKGFSDIRLAKLLGVSEKSLRSHRHKLKVLPVYKRVDTCAAEFASDTAYMYSTYEEECEAAPSNRDKIMILGGGPNRIGQGIEFDYCCVHAALALREDGYETIMVNCNPETVSTDYDTSDRLYFEPVTLEDVLEIVDKEKPVGVIVQYGGQTPLKLALDLEANGVPIIGTSPDSIDVAEDRERFQQLLHAVGLKQPPNRTARTEEAALALANEIGYPLVVRPSYVLGGRAMEIVHGDKDLERYMREAVRVSDKSPVLLDRFLDDAVEVDMDCIADASGAVMIGGIMEHVEQAGVHSGDSACSLPPYTLSAVLQDELRRQTALMARALKVVGLMNVQFAIQGDVTAGLDACTVYVLEVNPRASRTVPFVSKATGQPLAKIAARCMAGQLLAEQKDPNGHMPHEVVPPYFSVKEAVFPFNKFPGVDPILSPEMRSTGEVMGVGKTFAEAMLKSQLGAGSRLPRSGNVVLSVKTKDHPRAVAIARDLHALGFGIVATKGTAGAISAAGIPVKVVNKVKDGRPHIADIIKSGDIQLVFTTVDETRTAIADSRHIRTAALANRVTYYTTMAGCEAATEALKHQDGLSVVSLQELHAELI
ncbi:carbamoyl-phosphate synthase large subunit [uncultured Sphaerotilus sp.]|uniref:carbamoyl-phosphate synthase large subunit n=1 Tax=uncultured Sphaerotilus sp. TaxID=474984 RepID=UPI0030CA4D4C